MNQKTRWSILEIDLPYRGDDLCLPIAQSIPSPRD